MILGSEIEKDQLRRRIAFEEVFESIYCCLWLYLLSVQVANDVVSSSNALNNKVAVANSRLESCVVEWSEEGKDEASGLVQIGRHVLGKAGGAVEGNN